MTKYKVIVKQVIVKEIEREIEADNIVDLQKKLEQQGQFIGNFVQEKNTNETSVKVFNDKEIVMQQNI